MSNLPIKSFNLTPENNSIQILLIIILAIVMFLVRTLPIANSIFTDWPGDYGNYVNFSADDAVYHMRVAHNTLHHFPWRVFFDPFTHFPFGSKVHFGPLFTLTIAAAALIVGLGHPTPELVNAVGAYTPVIMGILCLIPTYFIARNLFGKTAAIITAFILAFLPGEFLQRTALGFTDHHAAESLFSTITCACLIYALTTVRNRETSYRKILTYGIWTGIAYGLFLLTWAAALMFGVIFLVFFIAQLIIDHFKNERTEYLLLLALPVYITASFFVLPYALMNPQLELTGYSLASPLILISIAAIFVIAYITHLICKKNRLTKNLYSTILAMIFILIGFILYQYIPKLFTVMRDGCKMLFDPSPGMRTISEVRPAILDPISNQYTIKVFWMSYFWAMPLAIIGFGHLCYRAYKNINPTEILLLTWTIGIFLATVMQTRFNYYLAINIAILAGGYGVYPFFNYLSTLNPKHWFYIKLQQYGVPLLFLIFFFLIIDPIVILLTDKAIPAGLRISREKYNTFVWLKKHTPDPQGKVINKNFDYSSGYYPTPKNKDIPYNYPKSAYGIMGWWDMGHQITYVAERIPNTNPFQEGILEKGDLGAAPFFTSIDEEKAVHNLQIMGSRYVLIDDKNSTNILGIGTWNNDLSGWSKAVATEFSTSPQTAKIKVQIDSLKFLQSMLNRLYYYDTNNLKHFRLIHESDGDYVVLCRRLIFKPSPFINTIALSFNNYNTALKITHDANKTFWAGDQKNVFVYYARPPVKKFKIFELVKGAIISGTAPKDIKNGTKINISIKLETKFGRVFTYTQTTTVNDSKYTFTVPYPTTEMRGDNYSYDIKPLGNYQIMINAKPIEVSISEQAVMLGETITI